MGDICRKTEFNILKVAMGLLAPDLLDLALSDYYLFPTPKQIFETEHCTNKCIKLKCYHLG